MMLEGKSVEELLEIIETYNTMEKAAEDAEDAVYAQIEALKVEYERRLAELERLQEDAYNYKTNVVWKSPEETAHWAAWHEIERRDWLNGKWMGKKGGTIHFVKENRVPFNHAYPRKVICSMTSFTGLSEGQGKRVCKFCINMTEHIRTRERNPYEVPVHPTIER